MVARAPAPTQGDKYRIRVGQTIAGIVWSNVAFTVDGRWIILYDDGEPDIWQISESASGSSRTGVAWKTDQIAKKNGWVIGGGVFDRGGVPQRGQAYIQAFVVNSDIQAVSVSDILACGYVYAGHVVELGTFVEPGPAGGHGARQNFAGVNQAAGVLPADNAPVGAIWRIISYEAPLVTDATVGNRQFALVVQDVNSTSLRRFIAQNNNTQAATLTRTWAWFLGTDLSTSVGAALVDTQTVLPAYNLKNELLVGNTDVIRLVSTGTLAFTATDDFAAPQIQVEEWVMPN